MRKKRIVEKIFCVVMVFALVGATVPQVQTMEIMINGEETRILAALVEGRTLVDIGTAVSIFDNPNTRAYGGVVGDRAHLSVGATHFEFLLSSNTIFVNGAAVISDVAAQMVAGSVFVPLRFITEHLPRAAIDWDAVLEVVILNTPAPYVSTFAGLGAHGYAAGADALFNMPNSVFSSEGEGRGLLVVDSYNNLIRNVYNGETSRFAGDIIALDDFGFSLGFFHDGDLEYALFSRPADGAVGADGSIFIADSANHAVRVIYDGYVSTIEHEFNFPTALAFGPCGYLFVADTLNHVIKSVSPDGDVALVAGILGSYGYLNGTAREALFDAPMGIAVARDGTIFVADTGNHVIRAIHGGIVTTFAGTFTIGLDRYGWDEIPLGGFADGALNQAEFNHPMGLALFENTLIVADSANQRVRQICFERSIVHTLAGIGYADYVGGNGWEAAFHLPMGVYVKGNTLFVADTGNNVVRKIFPLGE
ncbi:MAG: stalk domain-containing protein [Defluviitaleaceae bacterium]|nr:stalk domain-containing protein [Defluviitaleaceae bacterium]